VAQNFFLWIPESIYMFIFVTNIHRLNTSCLQFVMTIFTLKSLLMRPFFATLTRFFVLLVALRLCGFTSNVNAAPQPAGWNQSVESASQNRPVFWLQGEGDENLGSEIPGRLDLRGAKLVPSDGYWEGKSGFVTDPATAPSSSLLIASSDTPIACSPQGTVVLLFQTPSSFTEPEDGKPAKINLFSRGTRGVPTHFEIAMVNGFLRLVISGEAGKSLQKPICKLEPSQWYWLAVRWKGEGGSTSLDWQLLAPPDTEHIDQGSVVTSPVGDASGSISIGGSYQKETPPVPFSQIIVWDSFISNEALGNLVGLLKK
jgi:hypothetical protein